MKLKEIKTIMLQCCAFSTGNVIFFERDEKTIELVHLCIDVLNIYHQSSYCYV